MAVTLYGNLIDYNGDRTFIAVVNCHGAIAECGEFQCVGWNCAVLGDFGETLSIGGNGYINVNCNCLWFDNMIL